ncbi:conserved hypothetical protein [Vibrio nigripulchritudo SOn1]|uniref:PD-(D/E)XK nuclease domain-containing protein n=1 Tax=Vibrio nigripulchritudo SOn1 TaxID=1238450 RepID=A0AAV2VNN8_9VIBR|nr:PD-(D/E)XK nuclease superfamily protein [Vibrio nigripulchritudo]CCO46260.1 conserved hypothetical protein [Vibrio nigripulchritudo SOn1]
MCRKTLLADIQAVIEGGGYFKSSDNRPFSYQTDVRYRSLISDKYDYAQFVLNTPCGTVQVNAKYQGVSGTTIEKLAYSVLDAERTEHQLYLVVCGGGELLRDRRAIQFLNQQAERAPKLKAMTVAEFHDLLDDLTSLKVA